MVRLHVGPAPSLSAHAAPHDVHTACRAAWRSSRKLADVVSTTETSKPSFSKSSFIGPASQDDPRNNIEDLYESHERNGRN